MAEARRRSAPNRSILVLALGVLLALIGLVLAVGGAWLAALGGSVHYLLAGLGLVVSGVLLFRGNASGSYLYLLIFALTVVWALWEVGLNPWALVPRVVGPAVLVLLALPLLQPVETPAGDELIAYALPAR